jgi:uncharacterized protein with gpF-like domain
MSYTDDELKRLERDIKRVYSDAYKDLRVQIDKVQSMLSSVEARTPRERYLLLKKDRLKAIEKQMIEIEANTNTVARQMIDELMLDIYKYNYNQSAEQLGFSVIDNSAVRKILTKEQNPFVMVKDLTNKADVTAKLQGEFMTSLLQGESIPKMARRLKNASEGYLKRSILTARTETTRVMNAAKMDIGAKGEELGYIMKKRWVATYDGRTRDEHLAMDGVEVDTNEPFILPDGTKMMFPGDISMGADAGQVCNCRCTMVEFILRDKDGNLVMKDR